MYKLALTLTLLMIHTFPSNTYAKGDSSEALFKATREKNHTLMKNLLQHNVDPNIRDQHFNTPLHISAFIGDEKAVRILLEYKASKHAVNNKFNTPYHYSQLAHRLNTQNNPEILKLLDC